MRSQLCGANLAIPTCVTAKQQDAGFLRFDLIDRIANPAFAANLNTGLKGKAEIG
jgi:hypothetical protein